jgi:hypothetical protein
MVRNGMTDRDYEVGDSILVPWGLDLAEGTVVGAYGEGNSLRVLVEVQVGDGTTQTLPFSTRALEAARKSGAQSPPGAWVRASRYEQELAHALTEILRRMILEWRGSVATNVHLEDRREIDICAQLPDRVLLVEAKHYSQEHSRLKLATLNQMFTYLRGSHEEWPHVALIVTNATIPSVALERAEEFRRAGVPLWVSRWRPRDEHSGQELSYAVEQALGFPFPG